MYGIIKNSKANLLHQVDQLKIWRMILGVEVDLHQTITSPFRVDNIPTCYLRQYNGLIFFTDWVFREYNKYTVIHAIAHLNGISYDLAGDMIHDYHYYGRAITVGNVICTSSTRRVNTGNKSAIFYEPFTLHGKPAYTTADVDYWNARDVSYPELLNSKQPCYSVKNIIVNGFISHPKTYPCYALTFETSDHFKLYCPLNSKEERFPISSATHNDYWKWDNNSSDCIITKSFKDGYLLNKLTGIDTYAFQSENMVPDDVSFLNKYNNKVILYDNDNAGMRGSSNLKNRLLSNGHSKVTTVQYPQTMGKDTDDLIVNGYKSFIKPFIIHSI